MCFLDVISGISPIQIWTIELAPEETESESLSKLLKFTDLGLNLGCLKPKLTDLRPGCILVRIGKNVTID